MYDPIIEQDINNAYFNLIFFFIIIFILIFFLYISFVYSTKPEDNLSISSADYSLYEKNSRQPDLLNSGQTAKIGFNGDPNFDYDKLYKYSRIKICPVGQCAIDTNNGSKRCPSDNKTSLSYDVSFEQCTNKFSCDYPLLPYAVQPDGSATNNNCGTNDIPCRCVANPQCAYRVMSTFDMVNGSAFNDKDVLDYYFSNNIYEKTYFTKEPISYDPDEVGLRYCNINPNFIDRIENGCNLSDSLYDPVDCNNSDLIQTVTDNDNTFKLLPQIYSYVKDAPIAPHNINKGDSTINIFVPSGSKINSYGKNIFKFTHSGTSYVLYSDSALDKTSQLTATTTGSDIINYTINYIKLYNVKSEAINTNKIINGFPVHITYDNNTARGTIENYFGINFEPYIYSFTPCQNNIISGANYKNMLNCLQKDKQPCNNGVMAYNIDKIINTDETTNLYSQENSRNFCTAFNKDRLQPGKDLYLRDPGYYTTSCVIGNGCDGNFNRNLCVGEDCRKAIAERKSNFFSNFDQSGVNNIWSISPEDINLTGDGLVNLKINSPTLLTLQPGDYWSRFDEPIVKFLNTAVDTGASILNLNNIVDLQIGMSVQYPDYPDPLLSIIDIDTNNSNITLSSTIGTSLQKNDTIRVISNLGDNDFGIIGQYANNAKSFCLLDITGLKSGIINKDDTNIKKDGIIIYKQFGFNGINYNTNIANGTSQPYRIYSESSVFKLLPNNTGELKPVQNINNLSLSADITTYSKQSFESANIPFKIQKSMYYPVWNNSNFKQECVMCDPSLLAYSLVSSTNSLVGAQIQFSGQSYFNYIHQQTTDNFVYTSFTKLAGNSNTNYMIMEDINTNIEIGDYIIDSTGYLDKTFSPVDSTKVSTNDTEIFKLAEAPTILTDKIINILTPNLYNSYNIIDKLGKEIPLPPSSQGVSAFNNGSGFNTNYNNSLTGLNYFTGKLYVDSNNYEYEIIPMNKVIDIIGNVLITDAPVNISLDSDTFIQTIKSNENLEISVLQDIDGGTGTGANATVEVSEITDGRITDIIITNEGSNYSTENRPAIIITNYYRGTENNIII